MADAVRGLRWRAAWLVAVAVVIMLWKLAGGAGGPVIQIEFGMVPELAGARVLVDGDSVGVLARRGARTLNGFRVREGEHAVLVGMEGCPGEPSRITAGAGATPVMLLADVEDRRVDGQPACQVVLRP